MNDPYTVVVIEDEMIAMEHICTIIAEKCSAFRVTATCEDGCSGLEAVKKYMPDLVITDIKMPGINGIDLIAATARYVPTAVTLVVSGYQDFQYVKGALTTGTFDYLLKPVAPANLQNILQKIAKKIEVIRIEQRTVLVQNLLKGVQGEQRLIQKYFPHDSYYGAILRKNSLPRRFNRSFGLKTCVGQQGMMTFYGRDENELLYLCSRSSVSSSLKIRTMIEAVADDIRKEDTVGFTTVVVGNESFPIQEIKDSVQQLYRTLDSHLIIGCSQILYAEQSADQVLPELIKIQELCSRIEYLLGENMFEAFRHKIKLLIIEWEKNQRTQLYIEYMVHQMFSCLIRSAKTPIKTELYEFMLDNAFANISSHEELEKQILKIIQQIITVDYGTFKKVDTLEFFNLVKAYIHDHYVETVSLLKLCSIFGISQTYMSKLFRKYSGNSFTQYVNLVRITKAKQMMKSQQNFKMKDISAMVGYKDQFYFSRLFHSLTGMTPSDYAAKQPTDDE